MWLSIRKVVPKYPFVIALLLSGSLILAALSVFEKNGAAAEVMTPLPRLVDVGADRCPPCIEMAPILEELRREYLESLEVVFVDVWKNPMKAVAYRARMIPTLIFYDASGKEVYRHLGYCSKKDILKKFEELGMPLKKPGRK